MEPRGHPISPAETEGHLQVNLSGSKLTVNALVEEFERLEEELFRGSAALAPARAPGRDFELRKPPPIRCSRCGSEHWVKRGRRPRQLKVRRNSGVQSGAITIHLIPATHERLDEPASEVGKRIRELRDHDHLACSARLSACDGSRPP